MNNRLRRVLFWLHLAAGVIVGVVVAVMSVTGAAMAFEAQIRDYAERGSRVVTPAADGARLPVDELIKRAQAARPGQQVSAFVVPADPAAAVRISLGREDGVHVNPYTGEVRPLAGQGTVQTLAFLLRVHRWLGAGEESREVGKAITGVANAAFFFLAITGLILWFPRRWVMKVVRNTLWFRGGLGGRARDFNWHNVIGFWSLLPLFVVTFSGMMISYRPVSNLIFTLAGEKPPAPGPAAAPAVTVPAPAPGAQRLPLETLLATARERVPTYTSLNVRMGGAGRGGARPGERGGDRAAGMRGGERGDRGAPQPLTVTVKAPEAGPPFASVGLLFDPFTGQVLKEERFAEQTAGRRARTWLRFLHTGEALGIPGQLIGFVICLGSLVLVYTGFAMALRRLRGWLRNRSSARAAAASVPDRDLETA
jgi:uncharacterized iron-regulated membrane protein